MSKPQIKVFNMETGEEELREMTDAEYAHHLEVLEQQKQDLERIEQRKTALNKLISLGLNEDDLKALGL